MAWIIVGAVLLLLWLALLQPVWFHINVSPSGSTFEMRYLWFRLRPSRGKSKPKKEKDSKPKKKSAKAGMGSVVQSRSLLKQIFAAIRRALLYFVKRLKLRIARLEGSIGLENPMDTGIAYGLCQSIRASLPLPDVIEIELEPDFAENRTLIWAELEGGLRPSTVISTAVILLWYVPKRKLWKMLRA